MRTCYPVPSRVHTYTLPPLRRRVDILLRAKWARLAPNQGTPGYGAAAYFWACEHGDQVALRERATVDRIAAFYGWGLSQAAAWRWYTTPDKLGIAIADGAKQGRYWWARNAGPMVAGSALWARRRQATGQRLRPSQVRVCRPATPYPPPKPQPAPVWARPGWLSEPYYRTYERGGYVGDDW